MQYYGYESADEDPVIASVEEYLSDGPPSPARTGLTFRRSGAYNQRRNSAYAANRVAVSRVAQSSPVSEQRSSRRAARHNRRRVERAREFGKEIIHRPLDAGRKARHRVKEVAGKTRFRVKEVARRTELGIKSRASRITKRPHRQRNSTAVLQRAKTLSSAAGHSVPGHLRTDSGETATALLAPAQPDSSTDDEEDLNEIAGYDILTEPKGAVLLADQMVRTLALVCASVTAALAFGAAVTTPTVLGAATLASAMLCAIAQFTIVQHAVQATVRAMIDSHGSQRVLAASTVSVPSPGRSHHPRRLRSEDVKLGSEIEDDVRVVAPPKQKTFVAWTLPRSDGDVKENTWSYPSSPTFNVRGARYLTDGRKVPSAEPVYEVVSAHVVYSPQGPIERILDLHPELRFVGKWMRMHSIRYATLAHPYSQPDVAPLPGDGHGGPLLSELSVGDHSNADVDASCAWQRLLPPCVAMVLNVPAEAPSLMGRSSGPTHVIVFVCRVRYEIIAMMRRMNLSDGVSTLPPYVRLAIRWTGSADSDTVMNGRMKGIAKLADAVKGSGAVPRVAMRYSGKPVLMAHAASGFSRERHGHLYIHRSNMFFEIVTDVEKDFQYMVRGAIYLCLGKLANILASIAYVIEGRDEDELPEGIFVGITFNGVDFHGELKRQIDDRKSRGTGDSLSPGEEDLTTGPAPFIESGDEPRNQSKMRRRRHRSPSTHSDDSGPAGQG